MITTNRKIKGGANKSGDTLEKSVQPENTTVRLCNASFSAELATGSPGGSKKTEREEEEALEDTQPGGERRGLREDGLGVAHLCLYLLPVLSTSPQHGPSI